MRQCVRVCIYMYLLSGPDLFRICRFFERLKNETEKRKQRISMIQKQTAEFLRFVKLPFVFHFIFRMDFPFPRISTATFPREAHYL